MADVQAFSGWRYDTGQVGALADVTAPPYDVIGPDLQKTLYERHPCNVIRLILNRDEPGDDAETRYRRAADFIRHWKSEGVIAREHEDALYVYHQEFDWEGTHYVRRGFLGRIRLQEFGKGDVYAHEQTMSGPKADRLALTRACRMNLSPIFGLFPDDEGSVQSPLEAAICEQTPLEVTDEDGVIHRMWPVTDHAVIESVRQSLSDKPIFIADGHHRYETACNYRNLLQEEGTLDDDNAAPNFVLMHFVGMSDPGLAILPTHRLVSGLPELTADAVREALGDRFECEEVSGPDAAAQVWEQMEADGGQNVFGFGTLDGRWLLARATDTSLMAELSPDQSEEWRGLGVSLLHRMIIDKLISDACPGAEPKCRYVHLMDEVTDAISERSCQLACLVAPADIDHVRDIASKFEKMPPKSTYFYPKLLSGLVFHAHD